MNPCGGVKGGAIFDPRGMVGRIYKEDQYTLLHTKYEMSGPCGFGEEDFFMFFYDAPGACPVWTLYDCMSQHFLPQGDGWQNL